MGSQRYRRRRAAPSSPQPITTSRSLNDLSDLQQRTDRRELQLSASSLSSEGSSSEGGPDRGTTVKLLWLSMLKVKKKLETDVLPLLQINKENFIVQLLVYFHLLVLIPSLALSFFVLCRCRGSCGDCVSVTSSHGSLL